MENIRKALEHLDRNMSERDQRSALSFEEFLKVMTIKPGTVVRNVFQLFHDMIKSYVGQGEDEYPDDPESINFVYYDCKRLFVEGADHPFFADRIFANRLINHVEDLKRGAQQNKIYIFDGPPGCGKSTFLNNLLMKFEEYADTEEGLRYEVLWRLDRRMLGNYREETGVPPMLERLSQLLLNNKERQEEGGEPMGKEGATCIPNSFLDEEGSPYSDDTHIEISCPSHDHPILMVPKHYRRPFLDDLFFNDEFKWKLFTDKEYEWVFRDNPCTICSSLYDALLSRLKNPLKVFQMIYTRPYRFNRRVGEGISVFNPGDRPMQQMVMTNPMLQRRINNLFKDSNEVKYLFSRFAKTNNGIYALMDIKSHNVERLIELHNIISEGVHKVEDMEENVYSLFIALMNPEDKKNIENFQSFSDRIEYVNIPYILDLNTEVEIYRNIFGRHIDEGFLPRVLHNFARVIISSRLNIRSDGLLEWIGDSRKYNLYCDENLQLLKMEIYTGYIPPWLSEEDRKRFTAKRRRRVIAEAETEGSKGFSGRDSIKIFNEFYSAHAKEDKLINMGMLYNFFFKSKTLMESVPDGFLDSLLRLYNYTVLHEVKESLYNYNEDQISKDIQNYLFAINFEPGTTQTCRFTGDKLEITEEYFDSIENRLLGTTIDKWRKRDFRKETQKEYTSKTLTQQVMMEGKKLSETDLYFALHERYVYNLKEKVLDPLLENENFRQAIKDFDSEAFKTYDQRIRDDVTLLMNNLCNRCHYTQQGAKEVCIYVIDHDLARRFAK